MVKVQTRIFWKKTPTAFRRILPNVRSCTSQPLPNLNSTGTFIHFPLKVVGKNLKNQKLKNPKMHVYKTNKTSTQNRKNNQPLFEESDIINMIFALQYPPKVHLSRDVYSNSSKSGWLHFRKNLKSKKS